MSTRQNSKTIEHDEDWYKTFTISNEFKSFGDKTKTLITKKEYTMADQSVYDGISDVSFDYVYDNLGNITESYITEFDTNTFGFVNRTVGKYVYDGSN